MTTTIGTNADRGLIQGVEPMTKGRHTPPLTPAQIRQREVATSLPTNAAWDAAEAEGTLSAHTIAVGTCQNTTTGYWHAWISLYGTDVTSVGVYATEVDAQPLVQALQALFATWAYDEASVAALNDLIDWGVRDTIVPREAQVLPDNQVRKILAAIAERQQRRN